MDAVQLVQRFLKDVGIGAELKLEEYGAYMGTTAQGKYEGMVYGPVNLSLDPDGTLYGRFIPDHPMNRGYVNDPKITAMHKEQRQTKDLEARRQIIFAIQRYVAEQQYYVYLYCGVLTASYQPYVKNYGPNFIEDIGNVAAALWLDR